MKYERVTENSLVKKSKSGDTKAFEELMSRSDSYLKNWMLNKTRSSHSAEELLQLTYIKCWNNIKKFKAKAKFKTWACRVGYNIFLDNLNKRKRIPEQSLEEIDSYHMPPNSTYNKGFERLNGQDIKRELDEVLDRLPEIHRSVLISFAIEGLTYAEIAKKTGCSSGTIMSRLFYARKKARKLVNSRKNLKNYGNRQ